MVQIKNEILSFMKVSRKGIGSALVLLLLLALPGEGAHVYVSVGSFLVEGRADRYIKRLEKRGMKTFTESVTVRGKSFTRVTLARDYGTRRRAKKAIRYLRKDRVIRRYGGARPWIREGVPNLFFRGKMFSPVKTPPVYIKPEHYGKMEKAVEFSNSDGLSLVNVGQAGVMTAADTNDYMPLGVVQVVPGDGNLVGPKGPILIFLNDRVLIPSIPGRIVVEENGMPIDGTVTILPNSNGLAILSFIPRDDFLMDSEIAVMIKRGMKDDGGNPIPQDVGFSVTAGISSEGEFGKNTGFENGVMGLVFQGDGDILSASQELEAPEGGRFAALSTGSVLTGNQALWNATSMMTCGPVKGRLKELSFKYNFISAEFNVYVGSMFDDSALLIVSGADTNKVFMVDSINIAGYQKASLPFDSLQGFPDDGHHNGITGWKDFTVKGLDIRGPVTLTFIVSDVGDRAFSSILCVDDIRMKMRKK